ncbi:hypothetical protein LCGC14_0852590 [marine sediment metagenome]|uniref:Uncharacterized protein n=1 Tax=marine sediment metagenome TaxID=412755 RepID=A0A0F9PEM9_9ZZZZ
MKTSSNPKIFSKKCQYCEKEITSLYEKQTDYNLNAHELACKQNPKNMEIDKNE